MAKYATHPELANFELKIGLLRFEGSTVAETSVGGGYKVVEVVVKGLTPKGAAKLTPESTAALKAGITQLEGQGVIGIAGESALMLPMQAAASGMTKLPVCLSPVLQVALLVPAHDKQQTFVIFSKYRDELLAQRPALLKMCGVLAPQENLVIENIPENMSPEDLVEKVKSIKASNPKLAGVILDCQELIQHSDKLRANTAFPVFDLVTLLDFFVNARADNPYFGTSYQGTEGAAGLVTKAQRKLFSPYEAFSTSITSNIDANAKVGVLRIDYSYPPIPGDTASDASYGYKVIFRKVSGLTFEKCQNAVLNSEIKAELERAVKDLEKEGVVAITGDCGFLMAYQPFIRALTQTPVVMSSILQAPMLAAANAPDAKFAIFTANSATFDKTKLLTQSGMRVNPDQWIVIGLQDLEGFEAVALGQLVPAEKVQPGIIACVKKLKLKEPKLSGILLECTELPHYADAIRAETQLPVVDAITIVDFFQNSCTAVPSFSNKVLSTFMAQGLSDIIQAPQAAVVALVGLDAAAAPQEKQQKSGGCCALQ